MARMKNKVALITGAASGIGRAAAVLFAREGARVVIADIDETGGRETERLAREKGEAIFVATDVTDAESVGNTVARAIDHYGLLNVLYCNAGGSTLQDGPVTEVGEDEFWRVIKLDLYGTFVACKYAIPELIKAGGGSVVTTASNVALMGMPGRDCYTAAKGGVASMTRSMAIEYASSNVRVNAVAPGATQTDRVAGMAAKNAEINHLVQQGQPLGWCQPQDIAYMALYLASDESLSTTGQVFSVDGGATVL